MNQTAIGLNESICSPLLTRSSLLLLIPALAPALGATVLARAGFALGVLILVVVAVTGGLNIVLAGRVSRTVRLLCTTILAITCASLYRFHLYAADRQLLDALGVFLPLVAVNVLVFRQAVLYESGARLQQYGRSVWLATVFIGVLFLLGAIREVLLTGELLGVAVLAIDLSFFGRPAGVLIATGSLLAVGRALAHGPIAGSQTEQTEGS